MKKKIALFSALLLIVFLALSWTTAGKFFIYPFQRFTLSDENGVVCGDGRFSLEPLSFVQEKIYVGGFEDSSNPKGYKFSLQARNRKINIYQMSDGFAIAEESEGKLTYGWTSKGFSTKRLAALCKSPQKTD